MNEDFFAGFDKSYIFYDDKNNLMLSFYNNGTLEAAIDDEVCGGKWRFSKAKQLIEIYLPDLEYKIVYKMKLEKEDKETNESFLSAKFVIKYEDEGKDDKKGATSVLRTLNEFEDGKEDRISKIEKIIVFAVFLVIFLIILGLSTLIPALGKAGIIYVSAIILTIQILFINKIKGFVLKKIKKHEKTINNLFYG